VEHPNLPSNSDKSKMKAQKAPEEDKSPLAPIVTNPVVQKRPSLGARFKGVFMSGDGRSVVRYIFGGVLVPAVKNMLVDGVTKGIERAVYGESSPRRPMQPSGIYGQTQYNRPVYRPDPRTMGILPDQPPHVVPRSNGELNFVLQTREEADSVVDTLAEAVSKYGFVSVADLYQLLGLPFTHQDNKWGWTIPQMASIRQVREGYHLTMPSAEPID
jgi:hypothetical protein